MLESHWKLTRTKTNDWSRRELTMTFSRSQDRDYCCVAAEWGLEIHLAPMLCPNWFLSADLSQIHKDTQHITGSWEGGEMMMMLNKDQNLTAEIQMNLQLFSIICQPSSSFIAVIFPNFVVYKWTIFDRTDVLSFA